MNGINRIASYLNFLDPREYGVEKPAMGLVNYVLDSYFAKIDERNSRHHVDDNCPSNPVAHIQEMWLQCEIHECIKLSNNYPAFARNRNAWAFSQLFKNFCEGAPYEVVPFLDQYEWKELVKGYEEFHTENSQLSIGLDEIASLPVYGLYFVQDCVTGSRVIVKFDFCHYSMGCSIKVIASPRDQKTAEEFFGRFADSLVKNDIYYRKCLSYEEGRIEFQKVRPTLWEDIVIKPDLKESIINNSVDVLMKRDNLASIGMVPNCNSLLISPPGMAKTSMFRAINNDLDGQVTRIWCTGKSIYYADHVTSLFEAARNLAPCIVFIEDMDLFGGDRGSSKNSPVLNEFLAQLDGAMDNSGVVIMASTNDVASMDEALINRPGRFGAKIEIPLPDEEDRRKMFSSFFKKYNAAIDPSTVTKETINNIVKLCKGFTGDYIKALVQTAVRKAVFDNSFSGGRVMVDSDCLVSAADQVLRNFQIGQKAVKHHQLVEEGEDFLQALKSS